MTLSDIVNLVCAKVGKTDDYAKARCLEYAQARHRFIYQSFDWTAAQDTIDTAVTANTATVDIAAEKVISARFNGTFIDPVTASYIFESHPELISAAGTPLYYWTHYDSGAAQTSVRLYPQPDADGTLQTLIKKPFDTAALSPALPNIDDVLIAFVLADMWEFLRQLGKYQSKLQEAQALLTAAQQRDTPSAPKPRTSSVLSVDGSTLKEMTDTVCDTINRWEPDIRESIKDRIRRNYQTFYDMHLLAESIVLASVNIAYDQQEIILPYYFDRIIAVRTNQGGPLSRVIPLRQAEMSIYFDIAYNIFEQSGEPVFYSTLPSLATSSPSQGLQLVCTSDNTGDAGQNIFVKGFLAGAEVSETFTMALFGPPGPTICRGSTVNFYDEVYVITKGDTIGTFDFGGMLTLGPKEHTRKHLRIKILPNQSATPVTDQNYGSVLVCGKKKMSQLIDDNDRPQIRNIANVLIAAASADLFDKLGDATKAAKYQQQAAALTAVLISGETNQSANEQIIVPYAEGISSLASGVMSSEFRIP